MPLYLLKSRIFFSQDQSTSQVILSKSLVKISNVKAVNNLAIFIKKISNYLWKK